MRFPLPTDTEILEHAQPRVVRRGVEYFVRGAVLSLMYLDAEISADVQGGERYHVSLSLSQSGDVEARCTCPYAREDPPGWCKHVVAVMVAAKAHARAEEKVPLEVLLAGLPPDRVRALLQEAAERDATVDERVRSDAAAAGEEAPPERPLRLAS